MTYKRLAEEAAGFLRDAGVKKARLIPSRSPRFGELTSLAAFDLAKELGRSPKEVAEELVAKLKPREDGLISSVEATAGYINFRVNWRRYAGEIVSTVLREGEGYGRSEVGAGKRVLVEHTSVNPNKSLHVGHARNVCIGDTLARLLSFLGYQVIVLNYIDDSGAQMADILLGFTELGYRMEPPDGMRFDEYCGDIVYVEVSRRIERDEALAEKRRKIARLVEQRESEYYRLNREIVERVLRDQLKTCWRLGAHYDILNMESDILTYDLWDEIFVKLREKRVIYRADSGPKAGCWLLDLSGHPLLSKEGDEVLVKSDGATTYVARDIAYAAWKLRGTTKDFSYKVWLKDPWRGEVLVTDLEGKVKRSLGEVERSINVIDVRQRRPQEIVRYALKLLGLEADRYIHYAYEVVALSVRDAERIGYKPEPGQEFVHMSGRRGLYVKADQLLDMLKEKIVKETRERHPGWSREKVEENAEKVAVGALRYALIKPDTDKLIVLDTEEILRFEGDTGPYLQYSYARATRILEKTDTQPLTEPPEEITEEEKQLLRRMAFFPQLIEEVGKTLLIKSLANYAHSLASDFSRFYERVPVLQAEEGVREFRLAEVEAFRTTLGNLMRILGVPIVEEM